MWFADIYFDLAWIAERKGVLGPCRFRLSGGRSESLGISIEFLLFGDEHELRHVRALLHTDDQQLVERCLDLNIQTWVTSIESAAMIETRRPCHVVLFDEQRFGIVFGQGTEETPALVMLVPKTEPPIIDYKRIAYGMAAWNAGVAEHLFYFRRFVDDSLPLDVRWLNGYRLLEWHFVRDEANLPRSSEWRQFVARFDDLLRPSLRANQPAFGLLEEARALAAHAGLDDRPEAERRRDPRNAIQKTFIALEQMVITVLNEHPARAGSPVQFRPLGSIQPSAPSSTAQP